MLRRFQTTSEGWLPTSRPCFVDPNSAAVPGMPTVTDLPRLGAMGIVSMSCITGLARTSHWRRMRRNHAAYSSPMLAASSPLLKWAGCITDTNVGRPEHRFRQLDESSDVIEDILMALVHLLRCWHLPSGVGGCRWPKQADDSSLVRPSPSRRSHRDRVRAFATGPEERVRSGFREGQSRGCPVRRR